MVCALYGTYLALTAYPQFGFALAVKRAQTWYLLTAGLLMIIGIYFVYCLLVSLQKIELSDEGFSIRDSIFRRQTFRWSEISGIAASTKEITFLGKAITIIPTGMIFLDSGNRIKLTNRFQGVPQLVNLIKHKVYPLLWQSTKSSFNSGQEIQFGTINLDHRRITFAGKEIAWTTIQGIRINAGNLVVELRDKFSYQVPLDKIQNLELLFKVIDWGISI